MRKHIATHWGNEACPTREAAIYHNTEKKLYEVDFLDDGEVIETREMVTENNGEALVHSYRYAEDAAENYCLGYMALDGRRIGQQLSFDFTRD